MGMFSWKTSDTKKSISNSYSVRGALPCKMLLPDGSVFVEEEYEGYGVFGGKDFYEALAELNGKKTREEGITIAFEKNNFISPRLVSIDFDGDYQDVKDSEICGSQGFMY